MKKLYTCPEVDMTLDFTIDLVKLPVGGEFALGEDHYKVISIGNKTILFEVNGIRRRLGIRSKRWAQFARDVEGQLLGYAHGLDAGCLIECLVISPPS